MCPHAPPADVLTARERQILSLLDDGKSYTEIGQLLHLEKTTVAWYMQRIYEKLNLESSQRNHRKAIVRARSLGQLASGPDVALNASEENRVENPYKGLRPFQQNDACDFYGRDALIHRLVARLSDSKPEGRFLAVVGPSGCGKSSVIYAGLIPALKLGALEGSEDWKLISIVPGSHPLDELEAALIRIAVVPGIDIRSQMERDERGLLRVVSMVLPEKCELLVVVDQFEEVFSLVTDEAERHHFLTLLGATVVQPHSRVRVIVALRADFYDRPLLYPALSDLVRQRTEVVVPLIPEELQQAICRPAERVGASVEPGLLAAFVAEVTERPGSLPLLQYSLTELFDRRCDGALTLEAYQQIGGVRGALTRHADALYESLSEPQQAAVRQVLLRLIVPMGSGEDLRRRVLCSELYALGMESQLLDEVIGELAQHRLLTLDHDAVTGGASVEMAHEALIREWGQLRSWLDESRQDIRQQRLLAAAAQDWCEAGEDPSYLLTGARMLQFQAWQQTTPVELTENERRLLAASENEHLRRERRVRRFRNAMLTAAMLLASVMAILALLALDAERKANTALARAEREGAVNRSLVLAGAAEEELALGYSDRALLLALEAVQTDAPPVRSERTFRDIAQGVGVRAVLPGHSTQVTSISVSPDGTRALSAACGQRSSDTLCTAGELILWRIDGDAQNAAEIVRFGGPESGGHTGTINEVAFDPASRARNRLTALSASDDGAVLLWDIVTQTVIREFRPADPGGWGAVNEIAFNPDGSQFLAAYGNGVVALWGVDTGEFVTRLAEHPAAATSVAFSADGTAALSASADGTTVLWDVATGQEMRRFEGPANSQVDHVAFGPGAPTVWGLCSDNAVRVWDLETAGVRFEIHGQDPSNDLAFTPDGAYAILSSEGGVHVRRVDGGALVQNLIQVAMKSSYAWVYPVAVRPDGSQLLTGDSEGKVQISNLGARNDLRRIPVERVTSLANAVMHPDGRHLLSSTGYSAHPSTLFLIDITTGEVVRTYPELPQPVSPGALAISPDGRAILVGGGQLYEGRGVTPEDPFLWLLDADTGVLLFDLRGHEHMVKAVAVSPDGRLALTGSNAWHLGDKYMELGELILWDLETGQIKRRLEYAEAIGGVAYSSDGRLAVTSSQMPRSANISVWDGTTGDLVRRFSGGLYGALDVSFGPDDTTIVASSTSGPILEIDLQTGEVLRRFFGLETPVSFDVAVSPDGRYVFASTDYAVLWDYLSGDELSRFALPAETHAWAIFPPDGETVLVVQQGRNEIVEWRPRNLSLPELIEWTGRNRYVRDWTCEERKSYGIEPAC